MEYFIALDFKNQVLDTLAGAGDMLSRSGYIAKHDLECRSNLHLTLRYLGHQKTILPIVKQLKQVTCPCLSLVLGDLGTFYNPDQTVIWAGVTGEVHALHNLKHSVDRALVGVPALPPTGQFFPHITLAVLSPGTHVDRALLRQCVPAPVSIQADAFQLYAIHREHGRSRFEKLDTFALTGRDCYA